MTIRITPYVLGPLENNTYLIEDIQSKQGCVIDPSFNPFEMIIAIKKNRIHVTHIFITHAHFDHIAGTNQILSGLDDKPVIGLGFEELELWSKKGDAEQFGISMEFLPKPDLLLRDGDRYQLGNTHIKVVHTPGHTPGHMVFSIESSQNVFCGDLIFADGIGRTDLVGGDHTLLMESIKKKILTLPDDTLLHPGHGPQTTVGREKARNPYL